ncbi:restriction system protein [Kitasatospora sp. MAP12-15]|uniref:restriction endonuclease n=1 Tax=unclassified Kitasatospora TaxID=2633591 RepID=UPI00247569C7|nr:restriction endonuclease [Kitasatospora sp. MAP12-44]MDH6108117.1 restriction system protein [Kitasatospora sp. MAP12-44]
MPPRSRTVRRRTARKPKKTAQALLYRAVRRHPARAAATVIAAVLLLAVATDPGLWWTAALVLLLAAATRWATRLYTAHRAATAGHQAWPTEQEQLRREKSLAAVDAMTGTEFEHHVAALCRRDGLTGVHTVGGRGDLGADVIAHTPTGAKIVIQCKRYAPHRKVRSGEMQTFVGTARPEHHADIAVFVASCAYTKDAEHYGRKHRITLVDRDLLAMWKNGTTLEAIVAMWQAATPPPPRRTPSAPRR